jgi:D-alanyl-D-alanine carboxypeptidase
LLKEEFMKTSYLVFVLLLASACAEEISIRLPDDRPSETYTNHTRHLYYQQELEAYRERSLAPGSILLVKKPQEDLWMGATGLSNLEHNVRMKTNDQFRTGSVTKMFTAVVMMKLVEAGKLSLEDKLAEQLPQVNGHIPQAQKITIRHLLAHQSGIFDPPNESLRYQGDIINHPVAMFNQTVERTLEEYVYGRPLHFEPGSNYSYSNTNYWLLGMIAERKAGKPLQRIMEEMIFLPLQMRDTYIEKRDDKNVVRGYAEVYNDGKLMDVSLWDRAEGDGEADGGIISTAEDLYRFLRGLFGGQLVSAATLQEMKRVQLASCNSEYCEYGLGLEIWRTGLGLAYGHNGGLVGIDANALYYESTGSFMVVYKNEGRGVEKSFLDRVMKP